LFLCEIYLEIISGKEKPPLAVLMRNARTLILVMFSVQKRVAARAGSGCLDRFPRTISGVLPGLLSLPHRGWDEGRA
jgi:hypothetical protein